MKKNIVILTSSDFPYKGASESFVRQMAIGLFLNEVDVEVIRFWGDIFSNTNDTVIKCSNYLFRKPFKNNFLKFLEALIQVLFIPFFVIYRKLFKRNQIIVMYGLDRAYFVFPLTLFSKLFNIKCYRIITEIYPTYQYANKWWQKPKVIFNKLQLKYFDRYLNGIVVLSNYLLEIIIGNGVEKKNILLIPHFIELELKEQVQEKNKKFTIGFCGNPSLENGVIDLLKAFVILSDNKILNIELIVIGNISSKVAKIIKELDIGKMNVRYTGLLVKIDLNRELQKCQVLVNPKPSSILADSGFPTKIGEYFATKKPVVSTKVGDLAYYLNDKKEIVFAEPNNPKSLADAILYLYQNKEKSTEIGLAGYKWANKNLDYIKNSKKLIDFVYDNSL